MINLNEIQEKVNNVTSLKELNEMIIKADEAMRIMRKKQLELINKDPKNWEILLGCYG